MVLASLLLYFKHYYSVVMEKRKAVEWLMFFFSLSGVASEGLFSGDDHLTVLTNSIFNKAILEKPNAWVVLFYSSWCGHCQRFAPIYKEFACQTKEWKPTVLIGAMDCSENDNVPFCREYDVISYPTLEFMGSFTKKGVVGTKQDPERDVESLKHNTIQFLVDEEINKRNSNKWVNLLNYTLTPLDVFKVAPSYAESAVLMYENETSIVGATVILDLGKYQQIYIRRIISNEVKSPYLIYILRNGRQYTIPLEASVTAEAVGDKILAKFNFPLREYVCSPKGLDNEENGAGDGQPLEPPTSHSSTDAVYMVDIENSLSYLINREVLLQRLISSERANALKNFLNVVVKYLPLRQPIYFFIVEFIKYMSQYQNAAIIGRDFNDFVGKINNTMQSSHFVFLPGMQQWIRCKGSKPIYRGYPCSLWTTFHTITVNAANSKNKVSHDDDLTIMNAIYGYIQHFFTCTHCAKNFKLMYEKDFQAGIIKEKGAVVWLWEAHNKANNRLKGDQTEDPEHPKIQFPSQNNCQQCYNKDATFNVTGVMNYLTDIYSSNKIYKKGLQDLTKFSQRKPLLSSSDNYVVVRTDDEASVQKLPVQWGFSNIDLNLCLLLYGASTLIIVAGYFLFVTKRRYRKRKTTGFHLL